MIIKYFSKFVEVLKMYYSSFKTLLNSSLMISLGAGALKVSGGPKASSREEVSMATLEAGTTQQQPLTGTVTLNNFSGDTYL